MGRRRPLPGSAPGTGAMSQGKRKALLFDRDGTLIVNEDYLKDHTLVRLIPGAAGLIREARAKGYLVFVVSNQSGIGRGWIKPEELEAVHREFCRQLEAEG